MWSLFSSASKNPWTNYVSTDMHAHFLPGIDDGSPDLATSLQLIQGLQEIGYKRLIATPHIMSGFYPNTTEIIRQALARTQQAAQSAGLSLPLEAAAEYFMDESMEQKIEEDDILCFGAPKCVLVEMSFVSPAPMWESIIFNLQMRGYQPVLAHPERYSYYHSHIKAYQAFIERGAWLQVNLTSLAGHYGKAPQRVARELIKLGQVHLVGTDLHHQQHLNVLTNSLFDREMHKALEGIEWKNALL